MRVLQLPLLHGQIRRAVFTNLKCPVSIIIPVFCEQAVINQTIETLRNRIGGDAAEIIVVDGQEAGETLAAIRDGSVQKFLFEKGRGRQLNRGATVATGDVLVFLHADTVLPFTALKRIAAVMQDEGCVGGAFDLRIDSRRMALRVIETVANLRSRLTRIPYGDQAIFIRASYFRTLGGFMEIPIMEDVDLMRRIKRDGKRIVIFREQATTSARRWEKEGLVFGTLRNWLLMSLYLCGVAPERLARFYK
ncbi:MAG: TIGR04283 family arsenosugar biosynthesis glycosyltransferase [Syntrophobacterales bacterium]|nr:TIGR04283 family arsenosugar biosynthesis glycosyltransferase [Syntrophobacterales bacterium]